MTTKVVQEQKKRQKDADILSYVFYHPSQKRRLLHSNPPISHPPLTTPHSTQKKNYFIQ